MILQMRLFGKVAQQRALPEHKSVLRPAPLGIQGKSEDPQRANGEAVGLFCCCRRGNFSMTSGGH